MSTEPDTASPFAPNGAMSPGDAMDDPTNRNRSDSRARLSRTLAAIAVIGLAVMWIYVLFLADPVPNGKLDDPTFPRAAEPVCAAALDDVGELPPAREARTANERATVVDQANERLGKMLDELDALVPSGAARKPVSDWLADWRIYWRDRSEYADALRDDPGARFTVTAKYGTHISRSIDNWADINAMPSCRTFPDV